MTRRNVAVAAVVAALSLALAACGKDKSGATTATTTAAGTAATPTSAEPVPTKTQTTTVEVTKGDASHAGFDPGAIYRREAPGVVTVISLFGRGASLLGGGGQGTGFVLNANGEIATNAHVVTDGTGQSLRRARQVYVAFSDGNQVPAKIVGVDPNSDVALIRVSPAGLKLRPLPLGQSTGVIVGDPVAAIGSPFGEPQSLSVGVISAVDRSIQSLTGFSISGAIQTDAAINHGNSGGPLVDRTGRVLGINSQIQSTGGGGEGVGFAVPIDTVRRSIGQLRTKGTAAYAYLGISTTQVYPQLAEHFQLAVNHGAWVQSVRADGPAKKAGLRAGGATVVFQTGSYHPAGDVIVEVAGHPITREADVATAIADRSPGDVVTIKYWRGNTERTVRATLGSRPITSPSAG